MSLINAALYGDKPIRAEYIYCDCYEGCPFYQNKTCLNCTSLFSDYCKFGTLSRVNGPKTKCRSRDVFTSDVRSNEKYSKLNHPGTWTIRKVNGHFVLNLSKWCIEKRRFIHNEWTKTEDYHWEGDYLVCSDYRSAFNPLNAKSVEIKFIPTEDMTYKITDNNQVIENTEFT